MLSLFGRDWKSVKHRRNSLDSEFEKRVTQKLHSDFIMSRDVFGKLSKDEVSQITKLVPKLGNFLIRVNPFVYQILNVVINTYCLCKHKQKALMLNFNEYVSEKYNSKGTSYYDVNPHPYLWIHIPSPAGVFQGSEESIASVVENRYSKGLKTLITYNRSFKPNSLQKVLFFMKSVDLGELFLNKDFVSDSTEISPDLS